MSGTATERHLSAVRRKLRSYAERGFFRSFEERHARRGSAEFRFVWLRDFRVTIVCDLDRRRMTLRDLFSGILPRSGLDRDLRGFVRSRQDVALPAPRRIDPKRIGIRCVNRNGRFSVIMEVEDHRYRYAATKAVSLAQETFDYLNENHVEYMVEHFDLPED